MQTKTGQIWQNAGNCCQHFAGTFNRPLPHHLLPPDGCFLLASSVRGRDGTEVPDGAEAAGVELRLAEALRREGRAAELLPVHHDLFHPPLDRANFTKLVLGCIEAKFCK